jgi:hypothetical protein
MRRWLLVLASAVMVTVGTASVAGASFGQAVGASTATWTVHFTGSGTSESDATINSSSSVCTDIEKSTTASDFSWTVTWHNVKLTSPASTGSITGILTGTAHESYKATVSKGCGDSSSCSKEIAFHADESSTGSNPAALIGKTSSVHRSNYNIVLDLISGADEEAECSSVDPADDGFYFAGTGLAPNATDPLAATARIPLTELRNSGKIIVLVRKGAFNYPTTTDCSDKGLGLTCSHDQTWSGTITMTRG